MTKQVWWLVLPFLVAACEATVQPTDVAREAATGIGFVQTAAATPQSPASTVAVKMTSNVTRGDLLAVVLGWNDVTSTIVNVKDSLGNSFRVADPLFRNPMAPNSQVMYFAADSPGGADTVTITLSAKVQYPDMRVAEYSGVSAVDVSASAHGTSTTASVGPLTTTSAPEVLVAAGTTNGAFFGAGAGYTERIVTHPDENIVEDEIVSARGSFSMSTRNDSSPWTLQVVAFKGASAADAGTEAGADSGPEAASSADASLDGATGSRGQPARDAEPEAAAETTSDSSADATFDAAADVTTRNADAGSGSGSGSGAAVPALVQHVSSSVNPLGIGETGNRFAFTLPNPVGAGNCLVLGLSYGYGSARTVAVRDGNGNAWPTTPAVSVTDGATMTSSIFVLPNANAGTTTVTVLFDQALEPVQYTLSEFYGVATVSPVNGTAGASTRGPNLATGSLTPATSPSGDLVWAYFSDIDTGSTHQATQIAAGSGFTLLDADIAWPGQGLPHGSEYLVQSSSAPVDPTMTVTQGSSDSFLGLAVSLKAANAGTAPAGGIRVVRINHNTSETPSTPTWNVQLPSIGNLLVLSTADWTDLLDISSITDSNGNTWAKAQFDPSSPQIWYAANARSSSDLRLSLRVGGTPGGASLQLWDIVNASANAFDVMSGIPLSNDVGGANLSNLAPLSPTTRNGLTISVLALGQGPSSGLGAGSPAGAVFDFVYYSGETDFDTMDNADGTAHFYNSTLDPESWSWVVVNGSSTTEYSSTAVHFNGGP